MPYTYEILLVYLVSECKHYHFHLLLGTFIFQEDVFYFQKCIVTCISEYNKWEYYIAEQIPWASSVLTLNENKNPFNWISELMWDGFDQQGVLCLILYFHLLTKVFPSICFPLYLSGLNWPSWNLAAPNCHQELRPLPENLKDQHGSLSAAGTSDMSAVVDGAIYKLY